jgi:hypothetical protein
LMGHAVWSQPFSKPSETCAMERGANARAARRVAFWNMFAANFGSEETL